MDTINKQKEQAATAVVSHDKTQPTGIVVSAYYRVHPDDRQIFIDAVIPDMTAAAKINGCVYYAFAQDITDPNTFHLTEGWADEHAYETHENSDTFLTALSTVVKNVRILDRQGVRYDVAKIHIDDPRGKVNN